MKGVKIQMKARVIIGGGWGDEGKGKVETFFTQKAIKEKDGNILITRSTGGANAGHTVFVNGNKIATHIVPGGIGYNQTMNLIGKGTLVELEVFFNELEEIINLGVHQQL